MEVDQNRSLDDSPRQVAGFMRLFRPNSPVVPHAFFSALIACATLLDVQVRFAGGALVQAVSLASIAAGVFALTYFRHGKLIALGYLLVPLAPITLAIMQSSARGLGPGKYFAVPLYLGSDGPFFSGGVASVSHSLTDVKLSLTLFHPETYFFTQNTQTRQPFFSTRYHYPATVQLSTSGMTPELKDHKALLWGTCKLRKFLKTRTLTQEAFGMPEGQDVNRENPFFSSRSSVIHPYWTSASTLTKSKFEEEAEPTLSFSEGILQDITSDAPVLLFCVEPRPDQIIGFEQYGIFSSGESESVVHEIRLTVWIASTENGVSSFSDPTMIVDQVLGLVEIDEFSTIDSPDALEHYW